jgi:hypothetical protein
MNETGLQYAEELLKRYNGTPDEWEHLHAIKADMQSAYPGKDYPTHTSGPWFPRMNGDVISKHTGDLVCECMNGIIGMKQSRANARLISAAPEMLEVLRWLDAEMDCRDNFGGCLFSIHDFEKVRRAIKLAMEG